MKILILIQCTNLGGMEQSTFLFIKELVKIGIKVDVLSLNSVGDIGSALEKEGASIRGIPYRGKFGWRSFPAVRKALGESDADFLLMVGHNLMAQLALGNKFNGKRVLSLHFHHRGVMPDWAWKIIYFLAAIQFKAIIYPSTFIHREALEIAPWITTRSNVISYPIPSYKISEANDRAVARRRLGLPVDGYYVGNAGWLIPRKRWDIFLRVAAAVARQQPEVRFLIAGNGPELESLQSLALELGIADRIIWMGWLKDLTDFYHSLNVMLFNSDWDAMGRTPLEAMAYGIPTVASVLNGGLGEIISDKKMGFFINTHDIEKLSSEIIRISQNPEAAQTYAEEGNQRIREVGSAKMHTVKVLHALGISPPQWYLDQPDLS